MKKWIPVIGLKWCDDWEDLEVIMCWHGSWVTILSLIGGGFLIYFSKT